MDTIGWILILSTSFLFGIVFYFVYFVYVTETKNSPKGEYRVLHDSFTDRYTLQHKAILWHVVDTYRTYEEAAKVVKIRTDEYQRLKNRKITVVKSAIKLGKRDD